MSELDITVINPKGIRSQALSKLLSQPPCYPNSLARNMSHYMKTHLVKEINTIEDSNQCLAFEGSATH